MTNHQPGSCDCYVRREISVVAVHCDFHIDTRVVITDVDFQEGTVRQIAMGGRDLEPRPYWLMWSVRQLSRWIRERRGGVRTEMLVDPPPSGSQWHSSTFERWPGDDSKEADSNTV